MAAQVDTASLTLDASSLSRELVNVSLDCHHDICVEIKVVAEELAQLSDILGQLDDAVNLNPSQYTNAFNEDLSEIREELAAIFVELRQCCTKAEVMNTNTSGVAWFFKKSRVTRFLRHLEALRGILLVMRTVLWHGKEYGTHKSERIAESTPHTMHEDRVILESILAQNRDAILDLHNLLDSASTSHQASTALEEPSRAGDHYKRLSESTGIETLSIADVLPASKESSIAQSINSDTNTVPQPPGHTFSKRGVRLGVHMSILDFNAHEAPEGLKKKWIQEARDRSSNAHAERPPLTFRAGGNLTPFHELSKISEVNSTSDDAPRITLFSPKAQSGLLEKRAELLSRDTYTPTRRLSCPPNTPDDLAADNGTERLESRMKQVMRKISKPSLRSSQKVRDQVG